MKAKLVVLVLLITSITLSASVPALCDQRLDNIQSRIKYLEQLESDYESAIDFWKDVQSKLQTGNYLVWRYGDYFGVPVPKDQFKRWITALILNGMEPEKAAYFTRDASVFARQMLAQAPGEIRKLELGQEQIKNQLFALLDERARIRESQSPDNKPGACTWQDCPCQWLANTCKEAKYGTSKESCKEWGGTYWHESGHCGKGNCSFSKVCPWLGHYCCK